MKTVGLNCSMSIELKNPNYVQQSSLYIDLVVGKGRSGERTSGIKRLTCSGPSVDRFVDPDDKPL